ncbi:bacteriocin immunity protein [Paenibacillus sp. DCT19]|uniref:bacteriocin immunity protein n=1 Tax=Paenibacillus sp. DCT19 TaxID=2211212 RepID=UPI000FE2224C|nr:bacteriocin immunity protein [Paenibacillus sp. DCT19]
MTEVTRIELIEWVRKLMNAEGTEAELDDMLNELQQQLPYTEISNLIYWDDRALSPEQIVEEALAARPIQLPPPSQS